MINGEHPLFQQAVNRLIEFQAEQNKELVTQANSTPLPGPLRDAFAITPEIQVDKYKVRPFFDRDFEFLQALDNPLYGHMRDKKQEMITFIQGAACWELCYLFTHPLKEVKALFKSGGVIAVKEAAADEFEEMGLGGHIEIVKAVMAQLEFYWAPVIAHQSADEDSKKNTLVDGTVSHSTEMDTNLRNVV